MRFKCFACGIEFATIEELARHKQQHQAGPKSSSGVICLGCGQSIPLGPSKADYSGPLTCPDCHRTMTVVIENSEVVAARLG
jgi:DNA-directed RNA polymerase subunit RPC12/RpoP